MRATAVQTTSINITAVNDAPVATTPASPYAATEQTALSLKNSGLSVADADSGAGGVTLTVGVTEGTLHATAGTSGATVSGDDTVMTISGTTVQIDALLNTDATSTISYIDGTDTRRPAPRSRWGVQRQRQYRHGRGESRHGPHRPSTSPR